MPDSVASEPESTPPAQAASPSQRLLVLAGLIVVVMLSYWTLGDSLTLEQLAEREQQLKQLLQSSPVLFFAAAFLVYVAVTGLSLPGATVLSLTYAWFFGFVPALILISFASTAGASVAFLLSRYLFGEAIQTRFRQRLAAVNVAMEAEGTFYLLTLRLLPQVPFFVVNVVMGLTRIPLKIFWIVSQIGMLPGTMAYVYAGSRVPDLQTLSEQGIRGLLSPGLLLALTILGLLPLLLRRLIQFLRRRQSATTQDPHQS